MSLKLVTLAYGLIIFCLLFSNVLNLFYARILAAAALEAAVLAFLLPDIPPNIEAPALAISNPII